VPLSMCFLGFVMRRYSSLALIPTQNPFSTLSRRQNTPHNLHYLLFVTSTMVENIEYDIGAQANWPPKHRSARGATQPGELDPMANMMISPFFKSAAVKLAKKGIVSLLNSATFAEFSSGDQWTDTSLRGVLQQGVLGIMFS
jgi:hypothetical protein